jgi:hypothetical protein
LLHEEVGWAARKCRPVFLYPDFPAPFSLWRGGKHGSMAPGFNHPRSRVMRFVKFTALAPLAVLFLVPAGASAAPGIACQLAEVYACTPGGCQKSSSQANNLPEAVTLNVKEKNLFSGLFGGEGALENGDIYEDEKVLILHGRRALQTWTAVVDKTTGSYSGSVSQIGQSFTQFGTCTGITP